MQVDREATRKALMDSVKIGKVQGMKAGAEVLRVMAKLGADLRPSDCIEAAEKLEAMARKIDAEIPRPDVPKI